MRFPRYIRVFGRVLGIAFLLSGGPTNAAEREIENDAPAGSTRAARSPIQRVFPAIARREPLLPRLSEKLDAFPPFVADTEIGAKFATFYKRGDRAEDDPENDLDEAWVAGGSLYYRSGWLARALRFEVEGFTSQPLVAKEDRGGTFLLEPRQNGYAVLGIANAQVQYAGYRLTGYRQYLDLPYLNRRLNRLTPNTFEAITLEKFEGPIRFSVGYTFRIKQRNSDEFVSMARAVGVPKDTGVWHGGVLWSPTEDVSVGAIAGHLQDIATTFYNETNLIHAFSDDLDARLDMQFTYQWEQGDDLLADQLNDTWNLGIRAGLGVGGVVFRLGYAMTGPNGRIGSFFGTSPSYVDLQKQGFNRPDEKVLLVSLSYDFARVGLDRLKTILNFAAGFDGEFQGEQGEEQELDLTADYRLGPGLFEDLWLRLRAAWIHDGVVGRDGTDVQLIVRYEFPVL